MSRGKKGFTLIELLTAIAVSGFFFLALYKLVGIVSSQNGRTVTYNGNNYYSHPSRIAQSKAGILFFRLQEKIDSANAVFVMGGENSDPNASGSGRLPPLELGFSPTEIEGMENHMAVMNSLDFRTQNQTALQEFEVADYDNADFTIITLTGLNSVTSVTQCKRVEQDGNALYLVQFNEPPFSNSTETEYRFFMPLERDFWEITPGAYHRWYRWDDAWRRHEEAPCLVVFPDPMRMSGEQADTNLAPISQYAFKIAPTN